MVNNLSLNWPVGCLTIALILCACGCAGIREGAIPASEYSIPDVSADIEGEFKLVK